jgi:thiamine-phosphate pyrophosphorylase
MRRRALLPAIVTRYYITDSSQFDSIPDLLACIAKNAAAGVEMIQIREKHLPDRELAALVRAAMRIRGNSRLLVNSRTDIAIACGACGVHLPSSSIAPSEIRRMVLPDFLIGMSCHDTEELRCAEDEGASFAVYGPVFAPLSKSGGAPPIGLDGLHEGCQAVRMPVLALGGITWGSVEDCMRQGAAGVAGITLFQQEAGLN